MQKISRMKILSIDKVREADQYTIGNEPIRSVDLMERAAGKVFEWLMATEVYGSDHCPVELLLDM